MSSDYNIGTSSVIIDTQRFIPRLDWTRDRGTKEESMTGFVEETQINADTSEVISKVTYLVRLTDLSLNNCRGHNNFLSDLRDTMNSIVKDYKKGNAIDPASGSLVMLL